MTAAFHCCAFWLQAKLRGVRRDLNSLTWDAFLEVPLSGLAGAGGPAGPAMGFGEGTTGHQQARSAPGRVPPACPPSCLSANQFVDLCPARVLACPSLSDSLPSPPQEEALWLGKWPMREAAGRAVDLAALKLLGPSAQVWGNRWLRVLGMTCFLPYWPNLTPGPWPCPLHSPAAPRACCPLPSQTNYPLENYQRHLATLASHSAEAVVSAIRKDAHLAMSRTSK